MIIHTSKPFNKYGVEACRRAYESYAFSDDDPATIGFNLGLTTSQVDAAIGAWSDLLRSSQVCDEVHGIGEKWVIEQHGPRFTVRQIYA
jgi:hypothetical protein